MSDIVERLRDCDCSQHPGLSAEAADEIERLNRQAKQWLHNCLGRREPAAGSTKPCRDTEPGRGSDPKGTWAMSAGARAMELSNFAWAVLAQLAKGSVWDGDLVSKTGRTELIKAGLAKRDRRDERGLMVNELTPAGLRLAAQMDAAYRPQRH